MKKVLILGAGLVTHPIVRYLLNVPNLQVLVASRTVSKAESLVNSHPRGLTMELNVNDDEKLEKVVRDADIAVSLLPYRYHTKVAEFCLKHNTNLVTTSYVSDAMRELNKKAEEMGLLFLNEIGLDPGIDHMSAMKIIHDVENRGGKIVSFESVCGGLPAPEANDNPFGYKFSWSPRGVVLAGRNNAHYLQDGKEITIEGRNLFKNHWQKNVESLGIFEVYPNRDSLIYKSLYGLYDAETIFRGTFRNTGWCDTIMLISRLGYLDDTDRTELIGKSYAEIIASLIGVDTVEDIKAKTAAYLEADINGEEMKRMEWLGLFSKEKASSFPPTYLDILTNRMLEKMKYEEFERDMIILQHDFKAEFLNGDIEEIQALLIDYGIPGGDSSMARTVSLPAAIAVKLIAEGKIKLTGVQIPNKPEIYLPVLAELAENGIEFNETYKTLYKSHT